MFVKSANDEGRVALWERHHDHPGGEVFVKGDQVFEVAETPAVRRALRRGYIVQVDAETPAKREKTGSQAMPAAEANVVTSGKVKLEPVQPVSEPEPEPDLPGAPLTTIKGIGKTTADKLRAAGIHNTAELAFVADVEIADLADDTGIAEASLIDWIAQAREAD